MQTAKDIYDEALAKNDAKSIEVLAAKEAYDKAVAGKISVVFGTSGSKDGAILWKVTWLPQEPTATLVAA